MDYSNYGHFSSNFAQPQSAWESSVYRDESMTPYTTGRLTQQPPTGMSYASAFTFGQDFGSSASSAANYSDFTRQFLTELRNPAVDMNNNDDFLLDSSSGEEKDSISKSASPETHGKSMAKASSKDKNVNNVISEHAY
ncbi:hypothetical protein Ciccas_012641 [Cichlidogyrus casuarinus]|uniref:Uncharacterized protein n=1 Tax=Cichlidogyrus casuarinus TaxID=1844966 RepID=A0ABD2PMS9_9PLAT